MKFMLIIMILLVVACSTSTPTPYGPLEGKEGYSDETVDTDLRITYFQGNSATRKEDAELFAKFRAIEICSETGRTYGHILQIKDKSFSKEITETTSSAPSYYYGMSPYYGRYGAYGPSMGYGTSGASVSSDTKSFPFYEVYFECVEKPMDARVSLVNLAPSQMKSLVKDLRGAIQVENVLSDSPNKKKLQKADIIIKANGDRVDDVVELYKASRRSMNNFRIEFLRDGVKKETLVKFKDVTELVSEAQAEIIKAACKFEENKDSRPLCKKK